MQSTINNSEKDQCAKIYPNLEQAWGLFAIFIASTFILGALVRGLIILCSGFIQNLSSLSSWAILFTFLGCFALIFALVRYRAQCLNLQVCISRKHAPWWIYPLLLPMVPAMALLLDALVNLIPMPDFLEQMLTSMVSLNWASFLTAVIAAVILEEILCRGIILEGLLHHTTPYKAILWSALIFATLHMNPWQGVAAFVIGCLSGWIYWKTRSLGPSIFIHFVNNALAFALLYLVEDPKIKVSEYFGDQYPKILLAAIVTVIIFGFSIYHLINASTLDKHNSSV